MHRGRPPRALASPIPAEDARHHAGELPQRRPGHAGSASDTASHAPLPQGALGGLGEHALGPQPDLGGNPVAGDGGPDVGGASGAGTTSADPSLSTTMCASRSPSVTVMVSQGSRRTLPSRTVPAAVGSQKAVPRRTKTDIAAWGGRRAGRTRSPRRDGGRGSQRAAGPPAAVPASTSRPWCWSPGRRTGPAGRRALRHAAAPGSRVSGPCTARWGRRDSPWSRPPGRAGSAGPGPP
jgi:hypothetical protein